MKKWLLTGIVLLAFLPLGAQQFRPRETWPFLYEDFKDGVVCSDTGDQILEAKLNISVISQKLLFLKEDTIMEADMARIFSAKIGKDIYVNVEGKMYKVLAESAGGAAVRAYSLDIDQMNKSDIGYGVSSSLASTQQVSAAALDSNEGTNVNQAMASRDGGKVLPVAEKTYILYCKVRLVPALKREVTAIPGLDKDAVKVFFKENKIKWTQPESLTLVADFLTESLK